MELNFSQAPSAIAFNIDDPLHSQFIIAASNLHAFNYGIQILKFINK